MIVTHLPTIVMPKYTYCCDKCENLFEIVHSINNKLEICEECSGSLNRLPSATFVKFKQPIKDRGYKVGELVKDHIEETKRELQKEKKRIGSEEYK